MIDELFKFPIIMIDGDNEEKKIRNKPDLGLPMDMEEDYDVIYAEAEYPYWDFIGVEDRWLPTDESLNNALNSVFEACAVRFVNVGQLLVPWRKEKFKSEIKKFSDNYEKLYKSKLIKNITSLNKNKNEEHG